MKRIVCVLSAGFLLAALQAYAGKITFDDLYGLPKIEDPQISPDGSRIAFTLTERDPSAETQESHICLMNNDGTDLRRLTSGAASEWHPRWSPQGKSLAFISDRDGSAQVYLLPLKGGEARPVTFLSTGVSGMEWSPSGESFVFVTDVFPHCKTDACNKAKLEKQKSAGAKGRIYDQLMFRHYISWDDGRIAQLYMGQPTGGVRNVYPGTRHVPTRYLGGFRDYDISPDGGQLCFVMDSSDNPAVWPDNDLYTLSSGRDGPERLTTNPGLDTSPRYSKDGHFIAYRSTARKGYESDQADLVIFDRHNGKTRNLTKRFDRSVGHFVWSPESKFIYFTAVDAGFVKVYRISVLTGKIRILLDDAVYRGLALSPDGTYLVLARSQAHEPYELFRFDLETKKLAPLTSVTKKIVERVNLVQAEEFWFAGTFGDRVHGFLTKPPDFDPQKKYPLVLLIHGGPQWCWLGDFNYYGWNTQLVAAQGYVVAQIDPHGSLGYGLVFKEYVSGNWGKGDYEDLMMGMDYLIQTYPFIDSSRTAALGRSFGGFMANWICGHTDRFNCLISVDGSFEQISGYGSTEELWFPEWEFNGTPWTNPAEYRRASPSTYAKNFKTPTMVIHGQKDYRVDVSQGLMMFTTLRRQGVPAQLVYFPQEGHHVKSIPNVRFVYEKQFEWLARWLK
ncbi:S9 family peptidase [Acidobacteriota bacterium]